MDGCGCGIRINLHALGKAMDTMHAEGEARVSAADLKVFLRAYWKIDAEDRARAEVRQRVDEHLGRCGGLS